MQSPVGHAIGPDGRLQLADFWAFVLNPWAIWQYLHNMTASVVTASFVVAGVGALWSLSGRHREHASLALRTGVIAGLVASCVMVFPTGDRHGKLLAEKQPATLAAMEGLFESASGAELAIIGQPNVQQRKLENPVVVPGMLSFLVYGSFGSTVTGLDRIPHDQWPDNIELLYYAYHVMAGLGTLFIGLMALSALQLWRGRLERTRPLLWALMLAMPFPYIATHRGVDDRGAGAAALAGVRADANGGRHIAAGLGRKHALHAHWILRAVPRDRHPLPLPRGSDIAHGPGSLHPQVVPAASPDLAGEAG
jgi:cytochrome d ubiquinol oxidase subunit I